MLKQKKVTIFTILIMVFNFIMPNTMMIANAVNENEVQKKLISIETSITNTNTLIEVVKGSALYENDSSTRVATDYFEKSFLVDENKFLAIKSLLSEGVRLSELILYADSLDLSDKYTKYINMGNSDVTIFIDDIESIKFNYEYLDKDNNLQSDLLTLLTKEEIESLINSKYLNDISNTISSYNSSKLDGLKETYLIIIKSISDEEEVLNNYINNVKEYENNELLLGNNPDMLVNNKNIYELFNEYYLLFEALVSEVDLSNTLEINDELLSLRDEVHDIYDKFVINNGDFSLLNNEVTLLENKYLENISKLKNYLISNDLLIDNINGSNVDSDFISITNEFKELNDSYDLLIERINNYLSRRPSDSTLVEEEIKELNKDVETYGALVYKEKLESIANEVLTEDSVDLLLTSSLLSDDVRSSLLSKKLSYYEIKLYDETNYKMVLKDNLMILGIIKDFNANEFKNNVDYDYNFEIILEDGIYYILLKDRNDKDLIKYQIKLKNDLDNNYKLDSTDIDLLKNLLVTDFTDDEKLLNDFNEDGILNVKDLTDLENYINITYDNALDVSSKFIVKKVENNDTITYEVYLSSNGIINGFSFDIDVSSDLLFEEYITDFNLVLDNSSNPSKVVGIGNFSNDMLLVKLVYKIKESSTKTVFNLSNGIIVNSNGNFNSNLVSFDIISRVTEDNNSGRVNTSSNNNGGDLVSLDNIDVKDDTKDDSSTIKVSEPKLDKDEEKISVSSVVKVVLVILLGTLIIYFLNKNDEKEDKKEFLNDNKKRG